MMISDALSPALFHHTPRPVRFLSTIFRIPYAGPTTRWFHVALATSLILLTAHVSPALAQSERGYEGLSSPTATQAGPDNRTGTALPAWAEPYRSPSDNPSRRPDLGPPVTANGIGPPDNPNRVPLGGIEWLILAGAGYGAFRLRTSDDDR